MSTLTLLGTGSSYAVPSPGCNCSVCQMGFKPWNPKYRTRCSALVQHREKNLLIDISPDFREQVLKHHIQQIDACLITHAHADAVMGLPDIRAFSKRKPLPVFANNRARQSIRKTFAYAFDAKIKTTRPDIELKTTPSVLNWNGLRIRTIRVLHPPVLTHGFRIKNLVYLSDIKSLPKESFQKLKGVRTLVLGATGDERYLGHQSIFEAIELAQQIGAKKTFFTHIGHRLEQMKLSLPRGMQLAYDGLKIKF